MTVLLSLLCRTYRAWPLRAHCSGRHTLACRFSMPLQRHMSVEEQCNRALVQPDRRAHLRFHRRAIGVAGIGN
jgi:hypothetical protein